MDYNAQSWREKRGIMKYYPNSKYVRLQEVVAIRNIECVFLVLENVGNKEDFVRTLEKTKEQRE
ncbi:hypothetical protein J7M23_01085 [Candidatus Sumerlaeota bacterium]|nr:hypothetical protein [Candidatus Sumerlaeota bacterium]